MKPKPSELANLLADLTTGVIALLTENEQGPYLQQRKRKLLATLYVIVGHVERL